MGKPLLAMVLLVLTLATGCSTPVEEEREGEIIYLQSGEIRTMMQKMAVMVFNLELMVENPPTSDPGQLQNAVFEQLGEIEKVAVKLGAGPRRTNHYLIDSGIDKVVVEIRRAQEAVRAEPADFGPAMDVIQQCKRCHLMR
jgi:hypothetical protein